MVLIRPETREDFAALRAVLEGSFPTPAEARLVDLLRESGRLVVSMVAEVEGMVVGHVGISPVSAGGWIGAGLAPLAVLSNFRKQGIGASLVRASLAACQGLGFGFAVVLGEPSYYSRFGFRPASDWGLSDEYGGGSAFQALEFQPGAIPIQAAGTVRYATEFASLGDDSS